MNKTRFNNNWDASQNVVLPHGINWFCTAAKQVAFEKTPERHQLCRSAAKKQNWLQTSIICNYTFINVRSADTFRTRDISKSLHQAHADRQHAFGMSKQTQSRLESWLATFNKWLKIWQCVVQATKCKATLQHAFSLQLQGDIFVVCGFSFWPFYKCKNCETVLVMIMQRNLHEETFSCYTIRNSIAFKMWPWSHYW